MKKLSTLNKLARRAYLIEVSKSRVAAGGKNQKPYEIVSDALRDVFSINARIVRLYEYLDDTSSIDEITGSVMEIGDKLKEIMDQVKSGSGVSEKSEEETEEEFGPEPEEEYEEESEESEEEEKPKKKESKEEESEEEEEESEEESSIDDFLKSLEEE